MLRRVNVELLILGAGWTGDFLIPLLQSESIDFAATTTTGRHDTLKFKFDPDSEDNVQFKNLPNARTILITFPLTGTGQSKLLTRLYRSVHGDENNWIQLGSTGIFSGKAYNDHRSEYKKDDPRAIAEDELLGLGGCVLNLAGLYGGARDPRHWVPRVAKTKEQVKGKLALHMIHGEDVARAIVATHRHFTPGQRWLLTDLRVYDWWDLIQDWGGDAKRRARETLGEEQAKGLEYTRWVGELMVEEGVRSLPRSADTLGRVLDSRAFWNEMGTWPSQGRVK